MKLIELTNETKSITTAAKNIRLELKEAFPGVKFSVTCKHGYSIDISWIDGPTSKEVDALASKYREGDFDGMVDSYEYKKDRSFTDKHGGAQYIFTRRDYSDELIKAA